MAVGKKKHTSKKNKEYEQLEQLEQLESEQFNHEQLQIQQWLRKVRFRRCLFGGVMESDVWKKILELNQLYEAALSAERARYDALLEERTSAWQVEEAAFDMDEGAEEEVYE